VRDNNKKKREKPVSQRRDGLTVERGKEKKSSHSSLQDLLLKNK